LIQEIEKALGTNPEQSPDFARIVNLKNWQRLKDLLDNETAFIRRTKQIKIPYTLPLLYLMNLKVQVQ
jgi:hypothetical protein